METSLTKENQNLVNRSLIGNKTAECAVTEWGQFSPCSVTCGKGLRMRQRFYVNQMKADMMGCDRQLEEKEMCAADVELCE